MIGVLGLQNQSGAPINFEILEMGIVVKTVTPDRKITLVIPRS